MELLLYIWLLKLIGRFNHEVICPSLTFIGTVNAISYLGAKPHFVDCDEKTLRN